MSEKEGTEPTLGWGGGPANARGAQLRRFPTVDDLERRARRRTPRFAYDFMAGGASDDRAVARNRAALDDIQIVPRYGIDLGGLSTEAMLFGRSYRLPLGIAPMGGAGLSWPGADELLARAAQAARIPYVLSTVANTTIERVAKLAPDVFWFQLYGALADDHRISFDLVRRAEAAGAHVLVVTLDIPTHVRRIRDIRNGLALPLRLRGQTIRDIVSRPSWALAVLARGQPRFENFSAYREARVTTRALAAFTYESTEGALTWDVLARLRERWPRALVVKGVLHPDDAERAVSLGADGVIVSNHGGRQFEAAPAPIDVLPAVAARIGERATVLVDGSMRSGLDVLKALACGAAGAFAGRAFLYGVTALGRSGGEHVVSLVEIDLRAAMGQIGARTLADVAQACVHHPARLDFERAQEIGRIAARASSG
jgi:L-lactate dehydrogenase (cytochrome)